MMAPNVPQNAATYLVDRAAANCVPTDDTTTTSMRTVSVLDGDESHPKGEDQMSTSPVCVSSFLSFGQQPSSSAAATGGRRDEIDPYRDGTFDVRRSSRKRRIKRGSLASNGGDGMRQFSIAYRIYRPELLTARDAAPLIVLHGGPSLPSGYLYPLADQITSRSIIFYDQLGCGRSEGSDDVGMYSISSSIDDLEELIASLSLGRFHLFGHSFGGILAYEYTKRVAERPLYEKCANRNDILPECLSVVLSNTSTSVKLSDDESDRILAKLRAEIGSSDEADASLIEDEFWKRNQCRTEYTPAVLRDAMDSSGVKWFLHNKAVTEYAAAPPSRWARQLPSALIVGGGHDFVTDICIEGWRRLFNHEDVTVETMTDCAHYPHLESPGSYGAIVERQCSRTD